MTSSIHPEFELRVILDEDHYEADAGAELERRLTAVAPTEVVRAREGSQRGGVLAFSIAADEVGGGAGGPLWRRAVASWLSEVFDRTSDLIKRENEARLHRGAPVLSFGELQVRFGDEPAVAVSLGGEASIPAEAAGCIGRARDLFALRAFGEDVLGVRIPACAVEQEEAGRLEPPAARAAADAASPVLSTLGGPGFASDERKRDEPSPREIDEAVQEAEEALRFAGDEGGQAVARAVADDGSNRGAPAFSCAADWRMWEVDYADGTQLRYDSVLAETVPGR